jgi:hypothetical protein
MVQMPVEGGVLALLLERQEAGHGVLIMIKHNYSQ